MFKDRAVGYFVSECVLSFTDMGENEVKIYFQFLEIAKRLKHVSSKSLAKIVQWSIFMAEKSFGTR